MLSNYTAVHVEVKPQLLARKRPGPWLVFLPGAILALAALVSLTSGPLSINGDSGERSWEALVAFTLIFILFGSGLSVVILRRKHMI